MSNLLTSYHERKSCRVCGNANIQPVLSLGSLYVSGFMDSSDGSDKHVRAPLDLVLCQECALLQLKHTVNPELMYRQYWYRSVINSTMRMALADITASVEKRVDLKEGDIVVDIGCNDGTLLRSYRKKGIKLVGYEPARNLVPEASQGTFLVLNDFFNAGPYLKHFSQKAKVITSIAMFYDLEDPGQFVKDIRACLEENGLWVMQMAYLPSMFKMNAFDNICHEHLEYYSMLSLWNLLKLHGFKIVDVELNDVNGGSYRLYIKHEDCALYEDEQGKRNIHRLERYEKLFRTNHVETSLRFAERVTLQKQRTCEFIKKETGKGKRVYVYGASTKGNTLLQYYGLDHKLIHAAAERNPDKWGKYTVGTSIPIISEDQMRKERPDYLLILPWHFMSEFLEREKTYLNSGGKFIAPLPEFKVLPE